MTADYTPNAEFIASTASQDYAVAQGTTTVALTASPASVGVPVTLTATIAVSSGMGTPTGTVLFTDHDANGALRNLGTVTVANGQAVVSGVLFPVGVDMVTATYTSGDANFVAGSPAVLPISVGQGAPDLSVTASAAGPVYGQSDTVSATLAAGSGPAPTGSVTFSATGPGVLVTLGSAPLSASAPYVATLDPTGSPIPVGAETITASYGGDANFGATAASTESPTITAAPTSTSVTSSVNPSVLNQPVTFTAAVSDPATGAVPVGSVTFSMGAVALGSVVLDGSGQASVTTSPGVSASSTVSAVYTPSTRLRPAPTVRSSRRSTSCRQT